MVKVVQTPTFGKQLKKIFANQKKDLDLVITEIIANPHLGDTKKGDLSGVQVYKFNMVNQLTLLAYIWDKDDEMLTLLSLGSHENFYRNLKQGL